MAEREVHEVMIAGRWPFNSNGKAFVTIQAAINDLAGDGWVFVPEGTWAEALTIADDSVELFGVGRASLIQPAVAAGNAITISGDHDDIYIHDLGIDTKTSASIGNGIFIEDGADRFVIERVVIVDSDLDGIHIEGTTIDTGRILNCEVLGADGAGILVDMDGGNFMYRLHIDGCDVGAAGTVGISFATSGGNLYCEVVNNIVYSCTGDGITAVDFDYSHIHGNTILLCGGDGIEVNSTTYAQIADNIVYQNVAHGIFLVDADYCTVEDNHCILNDSGDTATYDGISVDASSTWNMILGNMCTGNHRNGIYVVGAGNIINSNISVLNDQSGISISAAECKINDNLCYHNGADANNTYNNIGLSGTSDRCTVNDNTCYSDGTRTRNGIILADGAIDCTVSGNICYNHATDGIQLTANNNDCVITGNNSQTNGAYGINIAAATCNGNIVKNNMLLANATASINDAGTDTRLAVAPFQFTEVSTGSAAIQVTSPTGCYVYGVGGAAITWGQLPVEVQQVVRLKVWAVAKDAPVGAGGQMHCEFTFNAGASNAQYNEAGKSWNLVNHDSEEADYVADDIVHWVIEDADVGTEIANLVTGDSFELLALYESAADPDGDTDAKFRVVEIEFV